MLDEILKDISLENRGRLRSNGEADIKLYGEVRVELLGASQKSSGDLR